MNDQVAQSAQEMPALAASARAASRVAASLSTELKNAVLRDIANKIEESRGEIELANTQDVAQAKVAGLASAKVSRLELAGDAIGKLAKGVRQVAALSDPVGVITEQRVVESGLKVQRVRCPLGVIAMIFEARPAVTVDAFVLCFKAGNACILKGGKESYGTNSILARIVHKVLAAHGLPTELLTNVMTTDRAALLALLEQDEFVDLVIPRGGEALIRFVAEHSRIATIQHFKGVCHAFVDEAADLAMAQRICLSGKTSAPATCNALECVLVHEGVAEKFVPEICRAFEAAGVEVRGDQRVVELAGGAELKVKRATAGDFGKEFLELVVAMKVVAGIDEAIEHIERFGSNHTETIITENLATAGAFLRRVQASCTLHNASTRLNDGFSLGLGAEIGISTTKLHAYGPMGLNELTTQRFVCVGNGQTR